MKTYKKVMYLLLAAILLLTPSAINLQAQEMFLNVDGLLEGFRIAPENKEGSTMVSMQDLFSKIDAKYEWKDSSRTTTATKGNHKLIFTVGAKVALVDGVEKPITVAPYFKGVDVMIPLRFVCNALGAEVKWEEKSKTIFISTGKEKKKVMDLNKPSTSDPIILTYQKALDNAYNANSTLINLSESLDYLQEQHKKTLQNIQDLGSVVTMDGITSEQYVQVDSQYTQSLRGLENIENTMKNVPINQQMIKESTEYMLRNSLSKIASGEMDYQLLESNIELQAQNVKNLELKLKLGMVSEKDVKASKQAYDKSKVNLDTLALNIKNEKSGLSKILLQPLDKEVIVEYEPTFSTESLPDVEKLIQNSLADDPTIKLKKSALDEAQYAMDSYKNPMAESKLALQNQLATATRAYDDIKRSLESSIRSAYNNIKQMHENEKSLQIDLEKAHDTYNTIAINYQAGLVTIYDLDTSKLNILQAEIAIAKNRYSYWVLTYGLNHPFLMNSSS